jgi:TetR/AcrR family transcriptional regulator
MRKEQSEKTRQLLLEVSLELFVHRGYAGTTVRDIAKRANVSPGLMFHYFPSKLAILEEHVKVVDYGITSVAALLHSGKPPLETFRAVATMILESFKNPYSKNLFLLANQVLSLEAIPISAKRRVSATKSLQASVPLIVLGQRKREIRKGDALALAVAFWGALQGIAEILVWNEDASIPDSESVTAILKA